MPIIRFPFNRNILSDLPDRLESYAETQSSRDTSQKLRDCARVVRGWLKSREVTIHCERSEDSWRWLLKAARFAGDKSFALILERRIAAWELERDAAEERKGFDRRTAAAMAEYREGGGE